MNRSVLISRLRLAAWVLVGVTVAPFALFWSRLPEPMASQWSFRGAPSSSQPRWLLLAIVTAVVFGCAMGLHRTLSNRQARTVSTSAATLSGLAALHAEASWMTVLANLDAPTWREAAPLPAAWILAALASCVTTAIFVRRWTVGLDRPLEATERPSAGLKPGEHAVFVGGVRAPLWGLTALVSLIAAPLAWLQDETSLAVTLLVLALVAFPFSVLRIVVDRRGLDVCYGPLGWPRQHIDLDEIEHAEAIDVSPLAHGGWGYRGLLSMGRASVVVRGGPGLELTLRRGRRFVVTMDDPQTAAGLLNDYKDQPSASH